MDTGRNLYAKAMTGTMKLWLLATAILLTMTGCTVNQKTTSDGYTYDDLLRGVTVDEDLYELKHYCETSDESNGGFRFYELVVEVTNTGAEPRAFAVRADKDDDRRIELWTDKLATGETAIDRKFIGWIDLPDSQADKTVPPPTYTECPTYEIGVYRHLSEAQ